MIIGLNFLVTSKRKNWNPDYYSDYSSNEEHDLTISIQETRKSFVFFMMESICEDIKLEEYPEEIAILKCGDVWILLFKLEQNGIPKYRMFNQLIMDSIW